MGWLLVVAIRAYSLISAHHKRRCLFRETCSLFVMRVAEEEGLLAGCRGLRQRFTRCRPQYSVFYDYMACDWLVVLADGSTATSAEIRDFVIEPYRTVTAGFVAGVHDSGGKCSQIVCRFSGEDVRAGPI
jgi:putative component of membrane protein insertase Oxa1/YidC/SpoIIIJ protein YidD